MALDAFLKIEGIPGESGDVAHRDWIEVVGYSLGMTTPTDVATGTAAGRCQLSPLTILKVVDKATPLLAKACGTNQTLKEIKFDSAVRSARRRSTWSTTLPTRGSAGFRPARAPGPGRLAHGGGAFAFAKIEWVYCGTDLGTGKPTGSVMYQHDWNAESR